MSLRPSPEAGWTAGKIRLHGIGGNVSMDNSAKERERRLEGFDVRISTGLCPIRDLSMLASCYEREAILKKAFAKVLKPECVICLGLVKPCQAK